MVGIERDKGEYRWSTQASPRLRPLYGHELSAVSLEVLLGEDFR